MNKAETRRCIETAWSKLSRLTAAVDRCGWAGSFLSQSFDAAKEAERRHRRGTQATMQGVQLAAMYFACKWACEEKAPPGSWAHVCELRDDARLGYAQGQRLRAAGCGSELDDIRAMLETIDYSRDLIGRAA